MVSQCESPRGFRVLAIKFVITEELTGIIQKLLVGFDMKIGSLSFSGVTTFAIEKIMNKPIIGGTNSGTAVFDFLTGFGRRESSGALGSASRSSPITPVGAVHIS